MSGDPGAYVELIAAEVRATLARHRVTGAELGRRLGRSHQWVFTRLRAQVPLDTDDLGRIAQALGENPLTILQRAQVVDRA